MKKIGILTLLSLFLSLAANAYDAKIDGICYDFNGDEAEVTFESHENPGYPNSFSVVIPESITHNGKTYRVTCIGGHAFHMGYNLTSVTIPNSVKSIDDFAFSCCVNLRSVSIPNSVTSIGDEAFSQCSSLTSVTIPKSVTSIGAAAFAGCIGLTSVTIPKSVKIIGKWAFEGCFFLTDSFVNKSSLMDSHNWGAILFDESRNDGLIIIDETVVRCRPWVTTVTIPTNVTSIGESAFADCSSLTSITIPNSVTTIGRSAFVWCSGLTSVTIPGSVTNIGDEAFFECSSLTSITIPNSVTSIGESAFLYCSGLTSITIPGSVTSIGKDAFGGCNSLTSITIPDGVTSIGDRAFEGCSSLTSITIPNSVTSIGHRAFSDCSGLTSFTIGNSVESIGRSAFYECSGLISITIPERVTSIESCTFSGCSKLTSVILPENVTFISDNAFENCNSLISINVPKKVESFKYLEETAWYKNQPDGLVYVGKVAYKYKGEIPKATHISIDEGTLKIADDAFYNCNNLISVTIPNSVTSIGHRAFSGCSGLTSVTIGNSVESIGGSAFYECSGLISITIPERVTSIKSCTFSGCSKLTSVILPENVTHISYDAFEKCNSLISINVPKKVESFKYLEETAWYKNQPDGLVYVDKVAYKYKGEMPKATHISINEGTIKIADKAFYNCNNLTSVTIPNSVTSIDKGTFYGCNNLAYLYIQNSKDNVKIESNAIPSGTRVVYKSPLDNSNEKRCPPILSILKNSLQIKGLFDDNALYSNSKCTLVARVHNDGERNAQMCVAKVSIQGTTSGIKMNDKETYSIEAGKTKEISIPFQTSFDTGNGKVTFTLQIIEKNGYNSETASVTVLIYAHGTNQLSAEGEKHKRAAKELVEFAKRPEDLFGAIEEYKQILDTDPLYSDAYFNLAELYKKVGNDLNGKYYSDAKSYYIQFKRLVPEESAEIDYQLYLLERLMKQ